MPLQAQCPEQAAEQLISANAMLAACPHLESAKCARIEVPHSLPRRAAASVAPLRELPHPLHFYTTPMRSLRGGQSPIRQLSWQVIEFRWIVMFAGTHTMQPLGRRGQRMLGPAARGRPALPALRAAVASRAAACSHEGAGGCPVQQPGLPQVQREARISAAHH